MYLFQNLVLLLKVGRPENYLVLLQSLGLSGPPGGLFVLLSLLPVPLVLHLIRHGVLLPLLDDGLRSQLFHVKVSRLGIKVEAGDRCQSNVLWSKVQLDLEFPLALLLVIQNIERC